MTDEQAGISGPSERGKRFRQVARTYLGGSTRAARELCQAKELLTGIGHRAPEMNTARGRDMRPRA
jgi:hypothetical protein